MCKPTTNIITKVEELIHHVGLETSRSFRNSAAYVQNWLTVLKSDKRFIVSTAGKADKAVEYILVGQ